MTRVSIDADVAKAMRILLRGEAGPVLLNWLREWRDAAQAELYKETEPMAMNRLVGEHFAISGLLEEIENSPKSEASLANGNSPPETGSGW